MYNAVQLLQGGIEEFSAQTKKLMKKKKLNLVRLYGESQTKNFPACLVFSKEKKKYICC